MHTLTNLEEKLAHDPQGLVRRQLFDEIDDAIRQFSAALRQPQSPKEFARLKRQWQSCLAAKTVIDSIWLRAQM